MIMEIVLIIGHGSPAKETNTLEEISKTIHHKMHPGCEKDCVRTAYLQFNPTTIFEAIEMAIKDGAKKLIIHPYFLSSGTHVTENIPEIINKAKAAHPEAEFIYTEPLGTHDKLADVVIERIKEAREKNE
jgi:sirohydrochlorin ferrochelatase